MYFDSTVLTAKTEQNVAHYPVLQGLSHKLLQLLTDSALRGN